MIQLYRKTRKRPIAFFGRLLYNSRWKDGVMTDVHSEMLEEDDFDTILSQDIDFSGILNFEKPFLIRGRVSGQINAKGLLVIDEEAVVNADINTTKVIIRGFVKGNVIAAEKVEVTVTGRLEGNLTAPEVYLETGCMFNGRCTMVEKSTAP